MSEDDERMERAERIRKLRKQGADTDTNAADDAASSAGEDGGPDEDGGPTDGVESGDTTGVAGQDADAAATAAGGGSSRSGGSAAQAAGPASGFELPDEGEMAAALGEEGATEATPAEATPAEPGVGQTARDQAATTVTEAHTRLLEFDLGDERYCIDIAGVEEIVRRETVTRVPNTPEYVEGVVDLRGQITTILDAKGLLDIDEAGPESLIVVFSPDEYEAQGTVGWIVDEVRQVRPVTEDQVRTPPTDDDYVEGIVDREEADELIVWVRPEVAMTLAVGEAEDG